MRVIILGLILFSSLKGENKLITTMSSENILIGIPVKLNIVTALDTLHFARFPELSHFGTKINIEDIKLSGTNASYTIKLWDTGEIIIRKFIFMSYIIMCVR